MQRKTKANGGGAKAAIALLIVAGAAWVNRGLIVDLTGLGGKSAPEVALAPGVMPGAPGALPVGGLPGMASQVGAQGTAVTPTAVATNGPTAEPTMTPTAPAGETASAAPPMPTARLLAHVAMPDAPLPDPFFRPRTAGAPSRPTRATISVARTADVAMVLATDAGAVALIDGRLLRCGDRLVFGEITAIGRNGVTVTTADGELVELPIRTAALPGISRPKPAVIAQAGGSPTDANPAAPAATAPASPSAAGAGTPPLPAELQRLLQQAGVSPGAMPGAPTRTTGNPTRQ